MEAPPRRPTASESGHPTAEAALDTGLYARALRRGWRLVVVAVAVTLLLGAVFLTVAPHRYAATASVLVTTTVTDPGAAASNRTTTGINLDTEAQVVTSDQVVTRVLDTTGDAFDAATVARHVTVSVPPNSTVLDISFAASSAATARLGAQAFAQAYLDARAEAARSDLDDEVASLQAQLRTAQGQADDINGRLAAATGEWALRLNSRLRVLEGSIVDLIASISTVRSTVVTPGRVIRPATTPSRATSPDRTLIGGSALALGLLAGLMLALARERYRPRLLTATDVGRELGLPLLGDVGRARRRRRGPRLAPAPGTPDAAAYVRLRRRLAATGSSRVVVAPAAPTGDAVDVALGLAAEYARDGTRVQLLTADGAGSVAEPVAGDATRLEVLDLDAVALPTTHQPLPGGVVRVFCAPPDHPALAYLTRPGDPAVLVVGRRDRAPDAERRCEALEAVDLVVAGAVRHPARRRAQARARRTPAQPPAPAPAAGELGPTRTVDTTPSPATPRTTTAKTARATATSPPAPPAPATPATPATKARTTAGANGKKQPALTTTSQAEAVEVSRDARTAAQKLRR